MSDMQDNSSINDRLDRIANGIDNLKNGSGLALSPNTVILKSGNLQQMFDTKLYYDVIIWINGSPTSDIVVNINSIVSGSIASVSYVNLNTTQTMYRLKGMKLNSISVSSSSISTYSVYITYLGYYDYKQPELSA